MPTPHLVLCEGRRGVGELAVAKLLNAAKRDPIAPSRTLVLVPTAASGTMFVQHFENAALEHQQATLLPDVRTVGSLFHQLATRAGTPFRLANPLLREAVLERAFHAASVEGAPSPFVVRGGLAARVLELYDTLVSHRADVSMGVSGRVLESFEARCLTEFDIPGDEGALKMAEQTRFVLRSLNNYRKVLDELDVVDPPGLREAIGDEPFPYAHVLVLGLETLAPADLALLRGAPGIESLTVYLSRCQAETDELRRFGDALPEVEAASASERRRPHLLTPVGDDSGSNDATFVSRDREESFFDVARLLKLLHSQDRLPELHRVGIVVPRPLPYLYLAKKVFREARIPFQLQDSFPLAAEPFLAAVDLVIELVASDARRGPALSLLRSPFFRFESVDAASVAAFDELTLRYRETGGTTRFEALLKKKSEPPQQAMLPGMAGMTIMDAGAGRGPGGHVERDRRALPALAAVVDAMQALAPMAGEGPATTKIACLKRFLASYCPSPSQDNEPHSEDSLRYDERSLRARGALDSILDRLADASRQVGDPPMSFHAFRDRLRRAVASHTFQVRSGVSGVHVIDARSACLGSFDLVILVGLNEGEWPSRTERNIFYPQWLLRDFGWPSDFELLASERARFRNLIELSEDRVALFRHALEDEVPTVPSPFLEDLEEWGEEHRAALPETRLNRSLGELAVSRAEALRRGMVERIPSLFETREPGRVHFTVSPPDPVSATALELYLRCPFKHFSRYLLNLEEEEDVDDSLSPLERGRILHDLLHEGFAAWDAGRESPRPVDADNYEEALKLFRRIAVRKIPREHRVLELPRLFGGPGQPGAVEWLLREEMRRGPLKKRLVEYGFRAPLRLEQGPAGESPWYVQVKGRVDRADVDADGYLHVYDYKTGRAPEPAVTLQVPLYAMALSQELAAPVAEAAYLSFRELRSVPRDEFQEAGARLVETYAGIRSGRFPPKPHQQYLCGSCGYVGVCRKEIEEERSS